MSLKVSRRNMLTWMVGPLVFMVFSTLSIADETIYIPTGEEAARVDENTVGVVFTHEELYHQIVHNMEDELETIDGLRIVPIMGKNHVQSIYDLLYFKGVDLALVRSDALEYVNRKTPNVNVKRVANSIVKISEEKIIIVARDSISNLQELAGKRVGLGLAGSGENVTGTLLLETLGIGVEAVTVRNIQAATSLVEGELDALVYLHKASDAVQSKSDQENADSIKALSTQDGLHILAIEPDNTLASLYHGSDVSHDDLPGLLEKGQTVATYAVDAVLAAYRWRQDNPRYKKVDRFVSNFIDSLDALKTGPYQPVWKRVSMDVDVSSMTRLALVTQKIEDRRLAVIKAQEDTIARREARDQARKQALLVNLSEQEAELNRRLGEKLSSSDTEELKKLLDELNEFMDRLGADSEISE